MKSSQEKQDSGCSIDRLISKLKAQLKQASLSDRMELISNHTISWTDALRHVERDPVHYNRKIVETNNEFQLLILTWLAGQKSEIHNHRGSQCVVQILNGTAVETVYWPRVDRTFTCESSAYRQGTAIGGEDSDIHTLENTKTARQDLVTMHVYFPPLKKMDLFIIRNDRLLQKN